MAWRKDGIQQIKERVPGFFDDNEENVPKGELPSMPEKMGSGSNPIETKSYAIRLTTEELNTLIAKQIENWRAEMLVLGSHWMDKHAEELLKKAQDIVLEQDKVIIERSVTDALRIIKDSQVKFEKSYSSLHQDWVKLLNSYFEEIRPFIVKLFKENREQIDSYLKDLVHKEFDQNFMKTFRNICLICGGKLKQTGHGSDFKCTSCGTKCVRLGVVKAEL